jgi:hypothetical protein
MPGLWRKLYNLELQNLHVLPSIVKMVKSRTMGRLWHTKIINAYRILVTKLRVNSSLGKPRYKWKDNIETECGTIN